MQHPNHDPLTVYNGPISNTVIIKLEWVSLVRIQQLQWQTIGILGVDIQIKRQDDEN
jgi:hypothetical protein